MGFVDRQLVESSLWDVAPVVSSGTAYASGDLVGANIPMEFTDVVARKCTSGVIKKVVIADRSAQAQNLDVVFMSSSPTASTFTDNAAFTLADADLEKVIGVAQVTEHVAFGDNGISQGDCNIPFQLQSINNLNAFIVSRGTPLYYSTRDLLVRLAIAKD